MSRRRDGAPSARREREGRTTRDRDRIASVAHVLERRSPHRLLVVLAVVGSLHLFFLVAVELNRGLVHRREITRLEAEVTALRQELDALGEVARHGADRSYRVALARNQGFVFPDETLLVTRRE